MSSFLGTIVSEPTSIVIRELTGERNTLELKGRCLPYRPLTLEGGMRAEFTWYPGNPVATVQMLGADERSTVINGTWKDRFLRASSDLGVPVLTGRTAIAELNGQTVPDVRTLAKIVDGFRMRGQLVEFRWDEITRHGILSRFRQVWLRREDLEWEIEFQWTSRGEPLTPIAFGLQIPNLDIASQISEAVDAIQEIAEAPFALVSQVNTEITDTLDALEEAAAGLSEAAEKGIETILTPIEVARNTLAALQSIKSEAGALIRVLEQTPARALRQSAEVADLAESLAVGETIATATAEADFTTSVVLSAGTSSVPATQTTSLSEVAGIAALTHEETIEAEAWRRDMKVSARVAQTLAAKRAYELAAQTTRVPNVRIVMVRDQDDLRDLSVEAYGTQEEWKRLLLYNNLSTSKLEAGQIVLIPPLTNQAQ